MQPDDAWRALLLNWPQSIPRHGNVVAAWGETITFVDFAISPGLVVFARDKPDSYGSRKVVIPYAQIAAIKLPTTLELSEFTAMGFKSQDSSQV